MKIRNILLATILLIAGRGEAYAVRAKGGYQLVTQSDGTQIEVMLCGDEWFNFFVTRDHVPLVLEDNGDFCYADAFGFGMKSSGVLAHEADRRTHSEQMHVSSMAAVASVEPYAAAARKAANARRVVLQPTNLRGKYRGLVILVNFKDQDFISPTPKEYFQALLNEEGFHDSSRAVGSVHDYFLAQSHGLFDVTFDVIGPVTVSDSCHQYKTSARVRDAFMPEVIKAIVDSVNFADYDWDGNGEVDNVVAVYAGYGRNEYNSSNEKTAKAKDSIWPMEWELSTTLKYDNMNISTFAVSNELSVATDEVAGIGTLCHEFSHCLGLADLYDTVDIPSNSDGGLMDSWELMDGGNYNEAGWCPPNYSAFERIYCGWVEPTVLTADTTVTDMPALADADVAYKVVNKTQYVNIDEYYLLENRQQKGWDQSVPSHGLVIWHIDFNAAVWRNNRPNADVNHLRCMAFAADNDPLAHYEKRRKKMTGIPYPYIDKEGKVNNQLTDTSTPAATVFTGPEITGNKMGKPIMNITESEDGLISFQFYSSNPAGISTVATDKPQTAAAYTLGGQRASTSQLNPAAGARVSQRGMIIVKGTDGKTKKVIR